jgi:hypothetical protein
MPMLLDDALKHLVSRHTAKFEGKWGIATPAVITSDDFDAWERVRREVEENKALAEELDP